MTAKIINDTYKMAWKNAAKLGASDKFDEAREIGGSGRRHERENVVFDMCEKISLIAAKVEIILRRNVPIEATEISSMASSINHRRAATTRLIKMRRLSKAKNNRIQRGIFALRA